MKKVSKMKVGGIVMSMLISITLIGQEMEHYLISSGGALPEQPEYQLSYTIGESVVHTLSTTGKYTLNQGFQQSEDVLISGIRSIASYEVNVQVYPNPTAGEVQVNIQGAGSGEYIMQAYDMQGRLVSIPGSGEMFKGENHRLDFGRVSGGMYIIEIRENDTSMKVGEFKVMKKN